MGVGEELSSQNDICGGSLSALAVVSRHERNRLKPTHQEAQEPMHLNLFTPLLCHLRRRRSCA